MIDRSEPNLEDRSRGIKSWRSRQGTSETIAQLHAGREVVTAELTRVGLVVTRHFKIFNPIHGEMFVEEQRTAVQDADPTSFIIGIPNVKFNMFASGFSVHGTSVPTCKSCSGEQAFISDPHSVCCGTCNACGEDDPGMLSVNPDSGEECCIRCIRTQVLALEWRRVKECEKCNDTCGTPVIHPTEDCRFSEYTDVSCDGMFYGAPCCVALGCTAAAA